MIRIAGQPNVSGDPKLTRPVVASAPVPRHDIAKQVEILGADSLLPKARTSAKSLVTVTQSVTRSTAGNGNALSAAEKQMAYRKRQKAKAK